MKKFRELYDMEKTMYKRDKKPSEINFLYLIAIKVIVLKIIKHK